MTVQELQKFNNRQGTISEKGLTFNVKTVNVRMAYGKVQVHVVPLAGIGSRWIDLKAFASVEPVQKPEANDVAR